MMELEIKRQRAILELGFEEVYILLQCVAEAEQRMSDGDVEAIIGISKEQLKEIGNTLNELKKKMRAAAGDV